MDHQERIQLMEEETQRKLRYQEELKKKEFIDQEIIIKGRWLEEEA